MELRGRIAGAAAVLVLTAALTAGSAASAQAPVAQVVPLEVGHYSTTEVVDVAKAPGQDAYLLTMHALDGAYFKTLLPDANYIAGGQGFCANELANGLTWTSLAATLKSNGLSSWMSYFKVDIQAAASTFCPQYLPIRN